MINITKNINYFIFGDIPTSELIEESHNKKIEHYDDIINKLKNIYNLIPTSFYDSVKLHHNYMKNNKKVKLVIWDLDEVAWEGSLIENTIKLKDKNNGYTKRTLHFYKIVKYY